MAPLRSRRSFLKMSGVAFSSVALTGCSQLGLGERGLALGHILIDNAHTNPQTVRIELERDNDLVLEETVELPADSGETIEATWSTDPAVYDLSYLVVGPDEDPDIRTKTVTADDKRSETCNLVYIVIGAGPHMPPYAYINEPAGDAPTCSD